MNTESEKPEAHDASEDPLADAGPPVRPEETAAGKVDDGWVEQDPGDDPNAILEGADPDELGEEADFEKTSPALTINIQSWATPLVGLVMLILGLAGGFYARPMIAPDPTPTAQPPAAAQPSGTGNTQQSQQSGQSQPQSQASAADRDALMNALLPSVRHFKGNPDAAITIIEFSDFQ